MRNWTAVCFVLFVLATVACQSPRTPGAGTPPPPAATLGISRPVQDEWDRLAAEARKEGELVIVGSALGGTKQAVSQAFRAKFGVNIEYIDGQGAEVTAKVLKQRQAGLYTVDVGHLGDSTFLSLIKPNKITLPLEPFLFLPEVLDKTKWTGGQVPYLDEDKHAIEFVAMVLPPVIINTDMVKPDEIDKIPDLLNPKWKGKIVLGDPSVPGTSNNLFTFIVTTEYRTKDEGIQFLRDLARQEPVLTRDYRLHTEWVARGKYPVGVGQSMSGLAEFKKAGAPLGYAGMGSRKILGSGAGDVNVFDRAPHPNAAKLYVNWILSKEGAEIWAPAQGFPSLRRDVANDHVEAALVPKEVSFKNMEYVEWEDKMRTMAAEIFK